MMLTLDLVDKRQPLAGVRPDGGLAPVDGLGEAVVTVVRIPDEDEPAAALPLLELEGPGAHRMIHRPTVLGAAVRLDDLACDGAMTRVVMNSRIM